MLQYTAGLIFFEVVVLGLGNASKNSPKMEPKLAEAVKAETSFFMRWLPAIDQTTGLLLASFVVLFLCIYDARRVATKKLERIARFCETNNLKQVPTVPGLPWIGHGLAFATNPTQFLANCYKKYGPMFRIKLFRLETVMVCDQSLVAEFLKAPEERYSLTKNLEVQNVDFALMYPATKEKTLGAFKEWKKPMEKAMQSFIPKVYEDVQACIDGLKSGGVASGVAPAVNLNRVMYRMIVSSSLNALFSIKLTESLLTDFNEFRGTVNRLAVMPFVLPKWISEFWGKSKVTKLRQKVASYFMDEVARYRADATLDDAHLLRFSVDHYKGKDNDSFIAETMGVFLYGATLNTNVAVTNVLAFIGDKKHRKILDEVREELRDKSHEEWLQAPLLNACIYESIRLTTKPSVSRQPVDPRATLGNWLVGNEAMVTLCSPLLLASSECPDSAVTFQGNPETFNPYRFLGEDAASTSTYSVHSWSGGPHMCPGKALSLIQLKIAVAAFVMNFDMESVVGGGEVGRNNVKYTTVSAFDECDLTVNLRIR